MNTTCPQLEQLYPFINWQRINLPSSVEQVTIVGLSHHPYPLVSIEQPTRLSFFQDEHIYSCHLSPGLEIISSQHGDHLYIFSFFLDKESVIQHYIYVLFDNKRDRNAPASQIVQRLAEREIANVLLNSQNERMNKLLFEIHES